MFKFKLFMSALALGAAIASAANPQWITGVPSQLKMGPHYTSATTGTGDAKIFTEGTPIFMFRIDGILYAAQYSGDKNKSFYDLAKAAVQSGKSLSVYADVDRTISHISCGDYSAYGCFWRNSENRILQIQELSQNNP